MDKTFDVGDRVLTVFGEGVVVGIEMFTQEGKVFLSTDGPWDREYGDSKARRAAIQLDEGHTWSVKNQNCYEWLTSITWLEEAIS